MLADYGYASFDLSSPFDLGLTKDDFTDPLHMKTRAFWLVAGRIHNCLPQKKHPRPSSFFMATPSSMAGT